MALHVIVRLRGVFSSTNVGVETLTSRVKVVAALSRCTPDQSNVSLLKRSLIDGRLAMSGDSGQKSCARRPMIGCPTQSEARNAAASTIVVMTGCRK